MMKSTRILLASMFGVIAGIGSARANFTYSQKTFMAQRPTLINGAMEYPLWHEHAYKLKAKGIRSNVQATMFYQHSQKAADIGKYFGVNGTNSFKVGIEADVTNGKVDIVNGKIVHVRNVSGTIGTVTFSPYQEKYGVRLDYFQDITHPFAKLFFRASTPIEHIATDVKLRVTNQTTQAFGTTTVSLEDFFAGKIDQTANISGDGQSGLTKAKINGKRSEVGIADLDLSLGYKYLDKPDKHVYLSFDVTVPTGHNARGDYLFEPSYGNGHHVGLGGRIHTGFELWKSDKASVKLEGFYRYSYLMEGTENRTLGLLNQGKFAHYYMVGKLNQAANTPLQPAANILTMPLTVKPGSLLETTSTLAFCCSGFTLNVGYNSFWKDQESVWVKSFVDNVYGLADVTFNTTNLADNTDAAHTIGQGTGANKTGITRDQLDMASVKTPALFTNKLFAGIGYSGHMYKKYLASIGVGGAYEFATSNADVENYNVWVKTCFSF